MKSLIPYRIPIKLIWRTRLCCKSKKHEVISKQLAMFKVADEMFEKEVDIVEIIKSIRTMKIAEKVLFNKY